MLNLGRSPTCGTPSFAMFANPIEKCAFKADVVAQSLGLDPFVAQDLLSLSEKLLVKTGLLYEVARRFGLVGG